MGVHGSCMQSKVADPEPDPASEEAFFLEGLKL